MISARNVGRISGGTEILRSVSFDVARGECLGVAGRDGSGRTTLLRILGTLLPPTTGEVLIDGLETTTHLLEVRRRIALVSFMRPLAERLRVDEYLRLVAGLRTGRARRNAEIPAALLHAGLRPEAIVGSLDDGGRAALAIVAALIVEPQVLLLDEPFLHVEPARRSPLRDWIGEAREAGTTVIWALTLDDEATAECDRVIQLERGCVAESAETAAARGRGR
jgi:ABC-2 type transport system ATP-binding protein